MRCISKLRNRAILACFGTIGPVESPLRVLIASERRDTLGVLAEIVAGLGHEVVASEVEVAAVAAVTAREHPDVALVELGPTPEHALDLIEQIVHEASCPVIALLASEQPGYVRAAAGRGVFAYIVDSTPSELQSTIDVTLQRFAEYHGLQGAFGRRAVIEQAKGILMARQRITADRAFTLLREHSQQTEQKLVDVATSIVDLHLLLVPAPAQPLSAPKPLTRQPNADDATVRGAHNPGTRVPPSRASQRAAAESPPSAA
jgi:AmiR/NasT family two-component response regulator